MPARSIPRWLSRGAGGGERDQPAVGSSGSGLHPRTPEKADPSAVDPLKDPPARLADVTGRDLERQSGVGSGRWYHPASSGERHGSPRA